MRKVLISALILCVSMSGWAQSNVFSTSLHNGLQVVVLEDHRAPLAVVQLWYRVGSSDEPLGLTGISHALEHMMFQGTQQVSSGEYSRKIAAMGGNDNAFTSYDFTGYTQSVPADQLAGVLALEADRMQHLTLDAALFKREMKAVMEERRMRVDDHPQALAAERFRAAAFMANPYQNPVIGWAGDIEQLTVQDLRTWYQRWYVPNNAILVVVGDVSAPKVLALAGEYFSKIQRKPLLKMKAHAVQKPLVKRRLTAYMSVAKPLLYMGYLVPSFKTLLPQDQWQSDALDVLSMLLDWGDGGILVEALKEQRHWVNSLSVRYQGYGLYDTLLMIQCEPAVGRSKRQVERQVQLQLKRLHTQRVSTTALNRVKALVIAQHVYEKDSIETQANQLGALAALNLPLKLADDYARRIQAVTAEQVRAVVRLYLQPNRQTLMWLEPQGSRHLSKQPKQHGGLKAWWQQVRSA